MSETQSSWLDALGQIGAHDAGAAENRWWWQRIGAVWLLLCAIVVAAVEEADARLRGTDYWTRHGFTYNHPKWCEARRDGGAGGAGGGISTDFIRESSNARSDYAYVFAGLGMLLVGGADAWCNHHHHHRRRRPRPRRTAAGGSAADEAPGPVGAGAGAAPGPTAAAAAAAAAAAPSPNALLAHPAVSLANGLSNVVHGAGSFMNHACQCAEGGRWDVAGMLAVVAWLALCPLLQLAWVRRVVRGGGTEAFVAAHALAALQLALLPAFFLGRASSGLMGAFVPAILLAVLGFYWRFRRVRALRIALPLATVGLFALAMVLWNLDKEGVACRPRSWVQGHAAWHTLTCFALVAMYAYFRCERARAASGAAAGVARSPPAAAAAGGVLAVAVTMTNDHVV